MKRSDLLALIDRLENSYPPFYESSLSINEELSDDIGDAADFLRQIAQAQPVAWRVRSRGQFKRFEPGPWRIYWSAAKPNVNAPQDCDFDPLYILPPED